MVRIFKHEGCEPIKHEALSAHLLRCQTPMTKELMVRVYKHEGCEPIKHEALSAHLLHCHTPITIELMVRVYKHEEPICCTVRGRLIIFPRLTSI